MSGPAVLALEDGAVFRGRAVGASGTTTGEVVFNTALTGYQEILSDPSYTRQLVTLTYPHIGNVGTNDDDMESRRAYAAGLIVRDVPLVSSNWRKRASLGDFLVRENVVAIADIDTRRLTRILREKGAQAGTIIAGAAAERADVEAVALAAARGFPGLKGMDLAKVVSTTQRYDWDSGSVFDAPSRPAGEPLHVVACDYGVKHNILQIGRAHV